MTPAEQTMQMPAEPGRGRRGRGPLAAALAVGALAVGGLLLATGDGGRPTAEIVGTVDQTVTTALGESLATVPATVPGPATTSPPTTAPARLGPDSRLSLDGVGPVRIGMTLAEASAAAGVAFELLDMPPGPECRYAVAVRASGTGDELAFMVVSNRIVRVDVGGMGPDRILTVSGIGKGSTEAEVHATYPGRIRVEPHPYTPNGRNLVYVPSEARFADRSLIFETVDGRVHSFRAGLAGPVSWPEGCS